MLHTPRFRRGHGPQSPDRPGLALFVTITTPTRGGRRVSRLATRDSLEPCLIAATSLTVEPRVSALPEEQHTRRDTRHCRRIALGASVLKGSSRLLVICWRGGMVRKLAKKFDSFRRQREVRTLCTVSHRAMVFSSREPQDSYSLVLRRCNQL